MRRSAKVLFVCLGNSGLSQMAESSACTHAADLMDAASGEIISSALDLAFFDVIVNLKDHPIPQQEGAYLLTLPVPGQSDQEALERVEQIVKFLANHFRWARK
jgi:hypothetical protein